MSIGDIFKKATSGLASGLTDLLFGTPAQADTSGINAAAVSNSAIAGRQQDLAEKQYADSKSILDQYLPIYKQQLQQSIDAQKTATDQSQSQWDSYTKNFQPVETQLAQKSLDYSNPARAEAEAARAAGDTTAQFDQARADTTTQLSAAGASPEKIAALEAAGRLNEAKAVGGAESGARRDTESKAMAYLDNAARFGRNMPSTGIASAQLANQDGSRAANTIGNIQSSVAAPAAAAAPLFQNAVTANNSAGNLFNAQAGLQQTASTAQYNANIGNAMAAAQMYASYGSSKKLKNRKGKTDGRKASDAIEASPSEKWSYKAGLGDGNTKDRTGPMAEDLAKVAPEVSDGETVDGISMLGLHHASLGDHNKRIARLERAASLSDAEV
jgi:hypothetical protein